MSGLTVGGLLKRLEKRPVIASVRDPEENRRAIESPVAAIFLISTSIFELEAMVSAGREAGKAVFLHIDLAEGLGRDDAAVRWCVEKLGVDGVISTRPSLLKAASELGVLTIQRLFLVDSASFANGKRLLRNTPPDFAEVLPAIAPKSIRRMCEALDKPVIAGGLISEAREIALAMQAGARAVSTGEASLWNMTL
ncbi:MAG: glycerol-3-phosphate responsive antiterminator [Clostridia bacterium]|nr:glycerol-3-phosphate responsive antiterminator [Clostridia bacterium]